MRIVTKSEFDAFALFVHDEDADLSADETIVARALTRRLRALTGDAGWEIRSRDDTGLDRFTLWRPEGDGDRKAWRERMRSVAEVREKLPPEVVGALSALDDVELMIDGRGEVIGSKQIKAGARPRPIRVRVGCPACGHPIRHHPREEQKKWDKRDRTSCGEPGPDGTCGCRVYQEEIAQDRAESGSAIGEVTT